MHMLRPQDRGNIRQGAKIDIIEYIISFLTLYATLYISIKLNLIEESWKGRLGLHLEAI